MPSLKKNSSHKARDAHGKPVALATTRDFAEEEQVHGVQRRGNLKGGSMGKTRPKGKR